MHGLRNPQHIRTSSFAACKAHFKLIRAGIQGHPYRCRQKSRSVCCRNEQLIRTLFLKLHFPPSDLHVLEVLHFPVIGFTPIVLCWSSFFRSSIFTQPLAKYADFTSSHIVYSCRNKKNMEPHRKNLNDVSRRF